jgi:hypothetical protein
MTTVIRAVGSPRRAREDTALSTRGLGLLLAAMAVAGGELAVGDLDIGRAGGRLQTVVICFASYLAGSG